MNRNIITIIISLLVMMSCEKGYITDCDSCTDDIPETIFLEINISGDFDYSVAPFIIIYEGAIEDNLVLKSYTTSSKVVKEEVMLSKDYTVAARYLINGIVYTAVDAARPELRFDQSNCDIPCYYIYNNVIDVRLRYRKY